MTIDAFDRPVASAAGDSAAEGNSGAAARADHKHAREAADANLSSTAGNISQIDIADTANAGALTTGARADHQHALPSPPAPTTSAVGDAAATGDDLTVARSDHVHGREAFATTSNIADIAATEAAGSSATVTRGDHVHALPGLAAWTSYTPSWTSSGTAPAIGNGTIQGYWTQLGKTVHLKILLTAGTTTTFGTGGWSFSLPTTSANTIPQTIEGRAAPAGQGYVAVGNISQNNTTVSVESVLSSSDTRLTGVTATVPASWTATSSNTLRLSGTYETA